MQEKKPLQLYSVNECAAFLAVSTKTIWRLIYAEKLESFRIGRRVLISEKALLQFVEGENSTHLGS